MSKSPIIALVVVAALAAGTALVAGYVDGPNQYAQVTADSRCDGCPKAGTEACCKVGGACEKADGWQWLARKALAMQSQRPAAVRRKPRPLPGLPRAVKSRFRAPAGPADVLRRSNPAGRTDLTQYSAGDSPHSEPGATFRHASYSMQAHRAGMEAGFFHAL